MVVAFIAGSAASTAWNFPAEVAKLSNNSRSSVSLPFPLLKVELSTMIKPGSCQDGYVLVEERFKLLDEQELSNFVLFTQDGTGGPVEIRKANDGIFTTRHFHPAG